jgi:3-hydroxyisobutyrate dehydrogenase-like beta-hydroxyacid dehydrogenase
MTQHNTPRLCFIGFGEAGQAFASGLREAGVTSMAAWDTLFPVPTGEKLRQAAAGIGVRVASSNADAVNGADIVISAVTAASSLQAAQQSKPALRPNQFFLDVNSVSPGRKQATSRELADAARYVDVAVMDAVLPGRHHTPILLGGPFAATIEPVLRGLDMKPLIAGPVVGNAAAVKMVRSVMIKGLEALTLECFLAASRAGVVDQIATSLTKTYPGLDWKGVVAYNLERMANHGTRRSAEMEQVADTLRELGLEPHMASATVQRQRQMGAVGKSEPIQRAIAEDGGTLRDGILLDAIGAAFAGQGRSH